MIPILYASQTGTGAYFAEKLAKKIGPHACAVPMDCFKPDGLLDAPFIIFICSTHGDGQPPFSMAHFWSMLMADIPSVFCFKYALLGLGDSSYPKYNWCGKMLYNRLQQLGAVPVLKVFSNTQDKGGPYEGYREFERGIDAFLGSYAWDQIKDASDSFKMDKMAKGDSYKARVVSNQRLTPDGYNKEIYEIIFDIPEFENFVPGDCLGILPRNKPGAADFFGFSQTETAFIEEHIDLTEPPRQDIFLELAAYTEKKLFAEKLAEISQDYDLYYSYIIENRRSIKDILYDFNINISFSTACRLCPIRPRYYSVAKRNGFYCVLLSAVEYTTKAGETRKGLGSEYLQGLSGAIEVEVVRSSLFFEEKNLLFFATGSGITLPRSVLGYFADKRIRIYQGFRHYGVDQLCKSEFQGTEIYYAASQDDKKYIMDAYRENPVENIDDWLVFVSGNVRLNKEIKSLLKEVHKKDVVFQSETW